MKIKILGPGCSKCKTLEEKVRRIVSEHKLDAEIIKVTDLDEIMKYGIMLTPGLVIDEQVKSYGSVPKEEQILAWLKK
jgi:small redox-active disulfide protein 2